MSRSVRQFAVLMLMLVGAVLLPSLARSAPAEDALARGFESPPDSAKPHTWWHWVNGNVSREGITADLEAMKRAGIGGLQLFNVSMVEPGPVKFMSPEWRELTKHAVSEADRLGLEICLHNCAGWSSSGGPWNTPEHGMQMAVWSERRVQGPGRVSQPLPQPLTRLGVYRDAAVLAFRTPEAEKSLLAAPSTRVSGAQGPLDARLLQDGDPSTFVTLPAGQDGRPYLQIETDRPAEALSLTLVAGPRSSESGELLASEDGQTFHRVASFRPPHSQPAGTDWIAVVPLPPTTARVFRLAFSGTEGGAREVTLAEVALHGGYRFQNWAGKTGFDRQGFPDGAETRTTQMSPGPALPRSEVVDLTARLDARGRLDWDVPQGDWTILRLGYTPIGRNNHPAPPEGTGLECDKLSREAVKAHWDGMMGVVLADAKAQGSKSINNVLIDSYETGPQNWTPLFPQEFRRLRGYDLLPWLPALTGRVVQDPQSTERFLWDFRRTIADLWNANYYGYFRELAHQNGLVLSVEGYGNGNFDDLAAAGFADIPMSEFWSGSGGDIGGAKEAASAAHVYGRPIVGAESFTAGSEAWMYDPASVKALGDRHFASGVNRVIFHTYVHQPDSSRKPGYTLGPFGLHHTRLLTWWDETPGWTRYLARCQYLLQQGRPVADLLYFSGEGAPRDFSGEISPSPPPGYDVDGCDPAVLLDRVTVRNGRLSIPGGLSYRALVLPDSDGMTPRVARKIRDLVRAGAVVVGPKPVFSLGLSGQPGASDEVRRLGETVWGEADGKTVTEHAYGRGRVYWGRPLPEVLAALKVPPDFEPRTPGARLMALHRRVGDAEVYFVSNQRPRAEEVECAFRVSGRAPELWHPDTGRREKALLYRQSGGRTIVTFRLEPSGSVFVVFRERAERDPYVSLRRAEGPVSHTAPLPKLEVRKAVYGLLEDPQRSVDVTAKVAALVRDGTLSVTADNNLAGDPAPNVVKSMRIDYTLDGTPQSRVLREGETLDIPQGVVEQLPAAETVVRADGRPALKAWEAGSYALETASGRRVTLQVASVPDPLTLEGAWEVRFQPNWGAPERVTLPKLASWTEHEDPGVRYFSGTATYVKEFDLPAGLLGGNRVLALDLGGVKNLAAVRLNGKDLGILWKPPFRLEVTDALRPGRNRLEVRVANLWVNRLIGDRNLPEGARPYTWTTHNPYQKDSPLLESGLLGPVTLRAAEVVDVR